MLKKFFLNCGNHSFNQIFSFVSVLILRWFIFVLSLFCSLWVHAQNKEIQQQYQLLQSSKINDSSKAESYIYLSYLYQAKNIDSALYFGNKAIQLSKKLNSPFLLADALTQQASNLVWKEQIADALKMYYQIEEIGRHFSSYEILYGVYNDLAYLYHTTENWDKAWEYCEKALSLIPYLQAPQDAAYIYHEMASLYASLHNSKEAESYFKKAIKDFYAIPDEDRVATCYMDMGRMYIDEEKISPAKFYLDSALHLFNQLDEPIQLAEVYELYGTLNMKTGAYETAESNFHNAYAIWKQNAMPDTVRTLFFLGKLFFLKHAFSSAQTYLQTAYNALSHKTDYKLLSETLLYLAKTDSALGKTQQAYKHWNEYKAASDSFYVRKMNMQVQELMLEYEVAKKEKENQLLKYQAERFKERLIYTIIIAVLLLAAIIFLLILNYQKKKMNRKLQFSQLEIQRAYDELKEAILLKDKLFSIIAHDLRAPLANTKSLLQLTQQGFLQKEEFENISKELSKNLEHSNELLDNLLHWAKSQMQGIQTEIKKIFLRPLVAECFQLFEAAAQKKKLDFENYVPDNCVVLSDENILRLALRNAISNAVKFSFPNGKIIVSCKQTPHHLQIFIQDFGKGISEENKRYIFSLKAVSTDGTHHEKGSGIGLKITMEMLHKVSGKISLESTLGQGTTVCLSLPS